MSLTLSPPVRSSYALLQDHWNKCTRCPLHESRRRVVHARGTLPCTVLFIGEAPGESEDSLGKPFIGPAGKLFDEIIAEVVTNLGKPFTYALVNLVGCWPKVEVELSSGETRQPTKDEIQKCQPHLIELIRLARPKLIVTLGDLARRNLPRNTGINNKIREASLIHPANILHRDNPSAQELDFKRSVLTLTQHIRALES